MNYLTSSEFDPELFTRADHAALKGPWHWLGVISERAMAGGLGGMVDDDLAYVAPWGVDLGQVSAPVLILQGGQDRIAPSAHGRWLTRHIRPAKLWLRPDEGHISVLSSAEAAMDWLLERANPMAGGSG
jgi:pimeloyl-ACP methyl ester carboxylesterase